MIALRVATVLAALTSSVLGVDIVVHSKGGNKTSDMPYGLLHEVCLTARVNSALKRLTIGSRISITLAMAASTLR